MGDTLANQLADRLLEADPPAETPAPETPKKKEREVLRPHQAYQNARNSFRELKVLMAKKAEIEARLEFAIGLRAELTRHGLHPDDVDRYVTRQSVRSLGRPDYERLGLAWETSQPLDIIGVVMKDGSRHWFVEPVTPTSAFARSLDAQDRNQNLMAWNKPRKGLPYTITNPEQE